MTDPRNLHEIVAELRRLHEAATPSRWRVNDSRLAKHEVVADGECMVICRTSPELYMRKACHNAALIAAMRNALPRLLDEVERAAKMEGDLRAAKTALKPEQRRHAKARRRIAELEAALREISAFKYRGRETVSEENAWPAFQKANAQACEIFDIARRALGGTDGTT